MGNENLHQSAWNISKYTMGADSTKNRKNAGIIHIIQILMSSILILVLNFFTSFRIRYLIHNQTKRKKYVLAKCFGIWKKYNL